MTSPAKKPRAVDLGNDLAGKVAHLPKGLRTRILEADRVADAPKFSRSGFTGLFGKLGDPINDLRLPVNIEERMRKRAQDFGLPFNELLREVIVVSEVGRDAVEDAFSKRLDAIQGIEREQGE